jgi:hypothetical protein
MMNDMKAIYGVVLGLLLKACELIAAAYNFLIAHGEERLQLRPVLVRLDRWRQEIQELDWLESGSFRKSVSSMLIFGENLNKPIKLSFLFYDNLTMKTLKEVST